MRNRFLPDETGFVVSSELMLIASMLVWGLLVGLNTLCYTQTGELNDVADAIGNVHLDYSFAGLSGHSSSVAGKSLQRC